MQMTLEDEDEFVEKRKRKTAELKVKYREKLEDHLNAGRDWV